MKKFKKISAMLMASVITSGTISSMSTRAAGIFEKGFYGTATKEAFKELLEDAYMIPLDNSLFKKYMFTEEYVSDRMFVLETENDLLYDIYWIEDAKPDYISASLESDVDSDALIAAMKEICPDAEVVNVTQDTDSKTVCVKGMDDSNGVRLPYDEVIKNDITYDQVIKIYDLLNETSKLKSCTYTKPCVYGNMANDSFIKYVNYTRMPNIKETIQNYIKENNLDWTITDIYSEPEHCITRENHITAEESLKISAQLYDDLGAIPFVQFLCGGGSTTTADTVIDMHNNLKGDANDDGELRLSDAIMILQSIGNPDEYQLTAQGKYNADIYGDRDGITTMDAVTVQRKILGLE